MDKLDAERIDGSTKPNVYLSYEAKRLLIMNDIAMNVPYRQIIDKYVAQWGLAESTVHRFIEVVKADMERGTMAKDVKELNTHRTNKMINDLMDTKEYDKAAKVIDIQNKTVGLYNDKKEDDPKDVNLTVKFNF